jgi:hypothetical protein
MGRGASERGQATVEWVGLVLGLALLLGALAAAGREVVEGESGRGLGEAVAGRMTCAVRDACGVRPVAREPGRPQRSAAPRRAPGRPAAGGAVGAAKSLSKGRAALGHAWLACFAYRRYEYEREHPLTPRQAVPFEDAVEIVNECLDPLAFLFG